MQRSRPTSLPVVLARVVDAQFGGDPQAQNLFSAFLARNARHAEGARQAMIAAQNRKLSWELRCAAIFMLEHHALALWSRRKLTPAGQSLLVSLGLISGGAVPAAVLDEGFSTSEPAAFVTELCNRLARLNYIHSHIRGLDTDPEKLLDFIYISRKPCKLSLARYLLDPDEVAGRILKEVRSSPGLPRQLCEVDYNGEALQKPASPRLNRFDRKLASQLRHGDRVLWVAEQTSSELNSLIEYPLGTVALVIKPPGSDLEFEVKRAGIRGPRLLNVLFQRNKSAVPLPHRLQGASYGHMLDYEQLASGRFAEIYRRVHGAEAPMSRCLGVTAISTVPNGKGNEQLMEYFSNAHAFGPGFEEMRAEMKRCVEAFEGKNRRNELAGPIGLTTRFILATVPNQAWMAGTSSFRLDRTAELLSPQGPEIYFKQGLGRAFTADDARHLADELLQEALGVYCPPDCGAIPYKDYIETALAMPCNRTVADSTYLECLADIGRYWGTLVAIGGYTEGESFVTRNVGLKSRWEQGRWRTRICFMDHDCMSGLGIPGDKPSAGWPLEGMRKDSDWICERPNSRNEFDCLRQIYGVSSGLEAQGQELFRKEAGSAHAKTRWAMRKSAKARTMFDREYVDSLIVRDQLVHEFLSHRGSEERIAAWKEGARIRFASTIYNEESFSPFCDCMARNAHRLDRYAFLYAPFPSGPR